MNTLTRWLTSLNTHHIFGIGVGTAMTSIATIIAAPYANAYVTAHAHSFGGDVGAAVLTGYINFAVTAAQAALPPAVLAAGFGKPPNIANQPTPEPPDSGTPVPVPLKPAA